MVIVSIMSSALFLWDIFQRRPVEERWDYTILGHHLEAHCVPANAIVSAAASEVRDHDLGDTGAGSHKFLGGGARSDEVHREVGTMHGGTVLPTPPPGQTWFSPSEQDPARHTLVDLCDPYSQNSQDDGRIGPGGAA
ncbi:hypothetical protein DL768_005999 [Monosporascus sp. mg162]|nr:hypothetical protein DL768_005999 [Monosporascus sp. mg162]